MRRHIRPHIRVLPLFLAVLACCTGAAATPDSTTADSTTAAKDAISRSTGAVLRGDSHGALDALRTVPANEFNPVDAAYRACMLERFDRAAPPVLIGAVDEPFVRTVLAAYQAYWWRALAHPAQQGQLEDELLQTLRPLLGDRGRDAKDFDALEPILQAELQAHGHHALLGRTAPLRELMLWRKQTTREYAVELPEGRQQVRAELLDDFVSLGWSAYGRCERGSTGGWATQDALYAVVPAYKDGLESEAFQVVFLDHEAQHFADKNRFHDLADWELEYRAKLVELVYASETVSRKRLGGFVAAQGDNTNAPHPYANARVVNALRARLGMEPDQAPLPQLQAAAREELLADSQRRQTSAQHAAK